MIAGVVNFDVPAVLDYQSSRKNCVPKVILGANCAGCPEISGPPIRIPPHCTIADLWVVAATARISRRGRLSDVARQLRAHAELWRAELGNEAAAEPSHPQDRVQYTCGN